MYALKLLPYRNVSWLTVAFICGSTLAFSIGALTAERIYLAAMKKHRYPDTSRALPPSAVRLAARASLLTGSILLAVFLVQLTRRYGIGNVVRVSETVRQSLVSGSAPKSFLYSEFALVAAALCSLSAALAANHRSRQRWLLACALAVGSLYFSTARQLIVNAIIIAVLIYAFAGGLPNMTRRLGVLIATVAVVTLAIFLGVGALIGNTYHTNDVSRFDNFFSRNPSISWLAPAYVDASAPIPALDIAVKVASTWGRTHGCATAPFECRELRHVSLDLERQPLAPPFTRSPLPWNAYTYIGTLLVDGGTGLVLLLVGLSGLLVGMVWASYRDNRRYGALAYAFLVPALVWAYRQNLLDVEVDAAVLAVGLAWVSVRVCHSSKLVRLLRLRVV
jgi:oligosaccharide repeat unit polymerase